MIRILRRKCIFNPVVWVYSLQHEDLEGFLELIESEEFWRRYARFDLPHLRRGGRVILDRNRIHEYHPLIQNRFHRFGDQAKSNILNADFKKTYAEFLWYLAYVPAPTSDHYLQWAYYFLLQDRIEEAREVFARIGGGASFERAARIQRDYVEAYLDVYFGYPNFVRARELVPQYLEYPVGSWRDLFVEIDRQLREYDEDQIIKFEDDESLEGQDPQAEREVTKN